MDKIVLNLSDLDFDFSINNEKDKFIKLKNEYIKCKDVFYSNAEKLAYDIHIQRGDCIYCNLTGKFIFGDFIGAFIKVNQLKVKELTIVSLSGGYDNFEMLDGLIDYGFVEKVNLMLSAYYLRTEKTKSSATIKQLDSLIEKHGSNFQVYYSNIHTKLVLIKTEKDGKNGYVVMHGSANLKSSQSMEQLIIQENKELYDFNYNYFKNLM